MALPSEVTKTQGDRIKDALVADSGGRAHDFALAGLTNSYLSYTATPEEYDGCTYEGSFTLFGRLQGPRYARRAAGACWPRCSPASDPASLPEPRPVGLGGPLPTADETPDAGDVVTQPARHRPLRPRHLQVEGRRPGGRRAAQRDLRRAPAQIAPAMDTVGTDDGFLDTTAFDDDTGEWTETWQFGECDPLGQYRFVVTGVADKGSGAAPYTVTSGRSTLTATAPLAVDAR